MATFTPPATTDALPTGGPNRVPPVDQDASPLQRRLYRHIRPPDRSPNLYRLVGGTYTVIQPFNDVGVVATYLGAHATPITAQEESDLTAAGYGAGITP